jgi:exonuclease III
MPRNPTNANGSVMPAQRGHAGVLLAIRSEWAQPHLLHRFSIPKQLEGHLVHIRIRMPDSKPLHIFAVYRSNSGGWRDLHAILLQYFHEQLAAANAEGAQVIMGGDWNGVLRPSDRSSGKVTRLDTTLQAAVATLNLTSAFSTFSQAQRTHSYQCANLTGPRTTSRLDDWLLPVGSSLLPAITQGPQVLTAEWTALSDHRPVILTLPAAALFSCPPTEPAKPVPRKPVLQRPFQRMELEFSTDNVRSQTGAAAVALTREIDSHLAQPPSSEAQNPSQAMYTTSSPQSSHTLCRHVSKPLKI